MCDYRDVTLGENKKKRSRYLERFFLFTAHYISMTVLSPTII